MKKYKPEQIVTPLRQVEVELANGKTTPQACKEAAITAQTCYPLAEGIRRIKTRSSQTSQGAAAGERQAEAARVAQDAIHSQWARHAVPLRRQRQPSRRDAGAIGARSRRHEAGGDDLVTAPFENHFR
jgi:hypothetical protein